MPYTSRSLSNNTIISSPTENIVSKPQFVTKKRMATTACACRKYDTIE